MLQSAPAASSPSHAFFFLCFLYSPHAPPDIAFRTTFRPSFLCALPDFIVLRSCPARSASPLLPRRRCLADRWCLTDASAPHGARVQMSPPRRVASPGSRKVVGPLTFLTLPSPTLCLSELLLSAAGQRPSGRPSARQPAERVATPPCRVFADRDSLTSASSTLAVSPWPADRHSYLFPRPPPFQSCCLI